MNIRGVNHTGMNLYATTTRIVEAKNAATIHLIIFPIIGTDSPIAYHLVCLLLCLVYHLLRSIEIYLNTAVLLASCHCTIVGNRIT